MENSRKIYGNMEKTFGYQKKQNVTALKSASDVINKYPRFVDVNKVVLFSKTNLFV